jgi:hypothetical protein
LREFSGCCNDVRVSQMRLELFEIHDQPWFPDFLRREVLDALQMIFERTDAYRPIAGRLRAALDYAGTRSVLDLFSGLGGPWPSLIRFYESEGAPPIEVLLTDKFPAASYRGDGRTCLAKGIRFISDPIDATSIPERFPGFRTIFSSFHHLSPAQAARFLQDSARFRRGIGIFEVASRHAFTLASIFTMPLLDWLFTPLRRPFRWSRLVWTYAIPVVPLVLFGDGMISCLRSYSLADLRAMTAGVTNSEYDWQIGEESSARLPLRITYLLGYPKKLVAAD